MYGFVFVGREGAFLGQVERVFVKDASERERERERQRERKSKEAPPPALIGYVNKVRFGVLSSRRSPLYG